MNNLGNAGFKMMATPDRQGVANLIPDYQPGGNLPLMKPDDLQYFAKVLEDVDEDSLPPEEQKERKIMKLLLKIKNGTPPMRKTALRQIHGQSARVRRRSALQSDPATAHVTFSGRSGASLASQSHRSYPLQTRRSRPSLRAQDTGRH